MIGGVYFQSTVHSLQIDQLQKIYKIESDLYKQQIDATLEAGEALYKQYHQEKANSQIKDQIIEKQHQIINQLFKEIERLKSIRSWDPDKIA